MTATWALAFALAQFPVGYGLDRYGPRRTVSLVMVSAALGSAVLAFAEGPRTAILAMALIGIGCAPVYMGALFVFGRVYPSTRFASLSSLMLAIGSAGNLLAATPLGWAAMTFGWRAAILVIGLAVLVSASLVAVLVRDPPRLTDAARDRQGFWRGFAGGIREVLSIRALWPLMPLTACSYALVLSERGLWAGPYLADVHHLDVIGRGNALLAMGIAMSAFALLYGPLDLWLGARKRLVLIASIVTGLAFLALAALPQDALLPAIGLLMLIGGVGHTYTVLMAHGRAFLPEHLLGRGITCLNFLFIGGVALVQTLSGAAVARMTAAGVPKEVIFAHLHTAFGVTLLTAAAVYAFSLSPPRAP